MTNPDPVDALIVPDQPRAVPSRKRLNVQKRVHDHLSRIDDPDLTNDVKTLVHLLNVEAARLRHLYRAAIERTEQ